MSAAETALRSRGSLAWAYAMIISLSATLFSLQTSEVRAQTFDFSFSGTHINDYRYPAISSITRGVITGSGGFINSISGFASGMSSTGLSGKFSFSSSDIDSSGSTYYYTNSSDYIFDVTFKTGPDLSMRDVNNQTWVGGYQGTSVVTLRSVAVPEIDGSVVPRAAFVMIGLFWIFKSRQRRLRLAEA